MKELLNDHKEFDFYFEKNGEPIERIKQWNDMSRSYSLKGFILFKEMLYEE